MAMGIMLENQLLQVQERPLVVHTLTDLNTTHTHNDHEGGISTMLRTEVAISPLSRYPTVNE